MARAVSARLRPCVDAPVRVRLTWDSRAYAVRAFRRVICMAISIFVRRVAVSAGFRRVSTTRFRATTPCGLSLWALSLPGHGHVGVGRLVALGCHGSPQPDPRVTHAVENERARLARKNEPEFLSQCRRLCVPLTLPRRVPCRPSRVAGGECSAAWRGTLAQPQGSHRAGGRPAAALSALGPARPSTNMPSTRVSPRPLRAAGAWGGGSRSRIGWGVAVGSGHRATGLRAALTTQWRSGIRLVR